MVQDILDSLELRIDPNLFIQFHNNVLSSNHDQNYVKSVCKKNVIAPAANNYFTELRVLRTLVKKEKEEHYKNSKHIEMIKGIYVLFRESIDVILDYAVINFLLHSANPQLKDENMELLEESVDDLLEEDLISDRYLEDLPTISARIAFLYSGKETKKFKDYLFNKYGTLDFKKQNIISLDEILNYFERNQNFLKRCSPEFLLRVYGNIYGIALQKLSIILEDEILAVSPDAIYFIKKLKEDNVPSDLRKRCAELYQPLKADIEKHMPDRETIKMSMGFFGRDAFKSLYPENPERIEAYI